MTIVRIAHAEPRPGKLENGGFDTRGRLVVLADDAGHRAVPVWLSGEQGEADLAELVEFAAQSGEEMTTEVPEELAARLLRAAGASVTGVDIDVTGADIGELSPQAAVTRVELSGPAGIRLVTATLSLGLAMAAAAGAPVRLAAEVLNRMAVPVSGEDLLSPLLHRVPPAAQVVPSGRPAQRPRFEPRNLDFADGLSRWDLDSGPRREAAPEDYSATAEGNSAVLSSAVPRPAGSATLVQAIFADDYRGGAVVFRGEIRAEPGTEQAGLRLEIFRHWRAREDHDAADHASDGAPQARTADELTARLLRAAGAGVTGVDIDELGPEVAVARIGLDGPAGTRHVTAGVTEGLAVAITTGAPVRAADPVMDRLAVPVPADGGPAPLPEPAAALAVLSPGRRPRYEPRNLAFADGLDRWRLGGSYTGHASHSHWQDYSCAAADGGAVLSSTVPEPAGFAFLGQEMFADDYRHCVVTFRGEFLFRDAGADGVSRAGLFLRVVRGRDVRQSLTERAAVNDPDNTSVTISAGGGWTSRPVYARVPDDADTLVFGISIRPRPDRDAQHRIGR